MPTRRLLAALAALAVAVPSASALATDSAAPTSPVQGWLAARLAVSAPAATHRVFVHATTTASAERAAERAGLRLVERFDAVDVVVAEGTTTAVHDVLRQPAVTYVEGDLPVEPLLDRVHAATRNAEAQRDVTGPGFHRLGGQGVSVAVIDTGVDGTHPFFQLPEGGSRVVANLKSVCHSSIAVLVPATGSLEQCWVPAATNDSDTASTAGHGTHVAGIAAGGRADVRLTSFGDERTLTGVAPDARLVALSVGQSSSIYGAYSALHWLAKHHREPCGAGVDPGACPPVRVVNNSYGAVGGSGFDPDSVVTQLNRKLVDEGVVVVYAAGNDGGDGGGKDLTGQRVQGTNGPGNDPTPGVLMVASYDDDRSGTRDGQASDFSSRGTRGQHNTYPDLSAPGDGITSSCRPQMPTCAMAIDTYDGSGSDVAAYATLSGTSMAAPYVAGVVAELFQLDPRLSPAQVEAVLEDSAHRYSAGAPYEPDPSNPGSPTSFDKGHGLVDVVEAVALLRRGVKGLSGPSADAPRVAPRGYQLPRGQVSCSRPLTDAKGDANDAAVVLDRVPNRAPLDLLAGRWEWDGAELTAVLVVDDLASLTRSVAAMDTYRWTVAPAGGDEFQISVNHSGSVSASLQRYTATLIESTPVDAEVLDRPGAGNDEVRVRFDGEDLEQLPGANPAFGRGLALTTLHAESVSTVAFVGLQADAAEVVDECPYRIGAADRVPR